MKERGVGGVDGCALADAVLPALADVRWVVAPVLEFPPRGPPLSRPPSPAGAYDATGHDKSLAADLHLPIV